MLPVELKVQSTADMKLLSAMLSTSINSLTLVTLTYLSFINSLTTYAFSMKHGFLTTRKNQERMRVIAH